MSIKDKITGKKSKNKEEVKDKKFVYKNGKVIGGDYQKQDLEGKTETLEEHQLEEDQDIKLQKIEELKTAKKAVLITIPGRVKAVNKKLLNEWEQWLRIERNRADTTCKAYIGDLRIFMNYLITKRNGSLKSVTVNDVRDFIKTQRRKECGPTIINRRLSALQTFYKWALRERYVNHNPASSELIDRFKLPERLPIHLTDTEHESFMNALNFHKPREKAFIALMNLCGLRISEACSIKIENLTRERDKIVTVRVIGKGDKERAAPIHPILADYIDAWLKERKNPKTGFLFPGRDKGHIGRVTGWRWFREFKDKVGLDTKITPHKLRHTYATRLYQKQVPIFDLQKMLGHADSRTTGIYAHVDEKKLEEHIKKLI